MTKRSKKQLAPPPSVDLLALAEVVERSPPNRRRPRRFCRDAFQFGDITRVSREAPVLILKLAKPKSSPAAVPTPPIISVALGAKVLPVTAVGEDEAGNRLSNFSADKNVDVSGIQQSQRLDYSYQNPLLSRLGPQSRPAGFSASIRNPASPCWPTLWAQPAKKRVLVGVVQPLDCWMPETSTFLIAEKFEETVAGFVFTDGCDGKNFGAESDEIIGGVGTAAGDDLGFRDV